MIVLSWPSKTSQSVVPMLAFNTTASTLGKVATLEAKDFTEAYRDRSISQTSITPTSVRFVVASILTLAAYPAADCTGKTFIVIGANVGTGKEAVIAAG